MSSPQLPRLPRRKGPVDWLAMPLLQPEALATLQRQGGAALVGKLVALFCQVAPQRVASLEPLQAALQPAQARRAAHGLAPLAAQLGARRLQLLAEAAEDALVADDGPELAVLYAELVGCCDQVCHALQRHPGGLGSGV